MECDLDLHETIQSNDAALKKLIKTGPDVPFDDSEPSSVVQGVPEQLELFNSITDIYEQSKEIIQEKIGLAERMRDTMDRHLKRLIQEMDKLEEQDTQPERYPPPVYTPTPSEPRLKSNLLDSVKSDTSQSSSFNLERKLSISGPQKLFPQKKVVKRKS